MAKGAEPSFATGQGPQGPYVSGIDALTRDPSVQGYWFERLIAFVIDAVIVGLAFGVIVLVVAVPFLISSFVSGESLNLFTFFGTSVYSFVNSVILVLYFALAESVYGTTLGKSIMHLKVVTSAGGTPTFEQTIVRDISKINWVLLLLDTSFGLALQTEYRQKFSDRYAGTVVSRLI